MRSVAISSVFSLVNPEFEVQVAEILTEQLPGLRVSLSHEIGRTGLLERENATVINAALSELAEQVCDRLVSTLRQIGIHARLYLSQKTVRNHVSNIFSKLEVSDRAAAILRARKAGLGQPDE